MMRAWHTTLRSNLPGIMAKGILTSKSQGKMDAVWFHTLAKQAWAFLHTIKRHGGDIRDVVSLEIDVPDECVKRSAAGGLYYSLSDIPPGCILGMVEFKTVAASPLEGKRGSRAG